MSYISIFEKIVDETEKQNKSRKDFQYYAKLTKYSGTLNSVLSELDTLLGIQDKSCSDLVKIALHPPRIIRSMIEYKIKYKGSYLLVQNAIDLALNIYSNQDSSPELVLNFAEQTKKVTGLKYFEKWLPQEFDDVSWKAYLPYYSKRTVDELTSIVNNVDIFFISLAHGGVPAGMDVFLRYCNMTGNSNSRFYAVRFSRDKMKDKQPQIFEDEKEYIRKLGVGRQVILFDEDMCTGITMERAQHYLNETIFQEKKIIRLANINNSDSWLSANDKKEELLKHLVTSLFKMYGMIKLKVQSLEY